MNHDWTIDGLTFPLSFFWKYLWSMEQKVLISHKNKLGTFCTQKFQIHFAPNLQFNHPKHFYLIRNNIMGWTIETAWIS